MITINEVFTNLKRNKQKAFIPYITAGDPNLDATKKFILALIKAGASIIELGVPFSDPYADGEINQRSSERALNAGTTLGQILNMIADIRHSGEEIPIVLFSYFNPIFAMQLETFAKNAHLSGVNGVLIVDLPVEEGEQYKDIFVCNKIDTCFLASASTSDERLKKIDKLSTGFLYYIARAGVTGIKKELSPTLIRELTNLRSKIDNHLAVGFGISNSTQAKIVADYADAVVIGSALVNLIAQGSDLSQIADNIFSFAQDITNHI